MDVSCEKCRTRFTIPDEKVPRDKIIKLACPKCKGSISLGTGPLAPPEPETGSSAEDLRLRFIEAGSGPNQKPAEESYSYEDYAGDQSIEFFEEGTKLALVLADSEKDSEAIRRSVENIGYKFISTPNTRDAIGKLRFHHFDLIILAEGFDGQPLDHSAILNYLNRLPMPVRRRIFLALISDGFKTMDNMMAFAISANVVINTKDTEKLHLVLKKAIAENEMFYKVYTDTLSETGKA